MKYTRSASFAQILKTRVETHWNVTLRGNVSWWVVANNPDEGGSHEVWWSLGAFTCLSKAKHRITLDLLDLVWNSMCRTELLQCTGELKKQNPKKTTKVASWRKMKRRKREFAAAVAAAGSVKAARRKQKTWHSWAGAAQQHIQVTVLFWQLHSRPHSHNHSLISGLSFQLSLYFSMRHVASFLLMDPRADSRLVDAGKPWSYCRLVDQFIIFSPLSLACCNCLRWARGHDFHRSAAYRSAAGVH